MRPRVWTSPRGGGNMASLRTSHPYACGPPYAQGLCMLADPEALRAEPFVQVGALLKRDVEPIIDRWCRRATEEQPTAGRVHHDTLRDHLPELLRAIGQTLAAAGNG